MYKRRSTEARNLELYSVFYTDIQNTIIIIIIIIIMAATHDGCILQQRSDLANTGSQHHKYKDSHSSLKCAFCKQYLLKEPRQLECGDRVCSDCYESFIKRYVQRMQ